MQKFHEIILTFFYCGKSKKMPGTVGSIASVLFWFLITWFFFDQQVTLLAQNIFWGAVLFVAFVYGSFASPIYVGNLSQKFSKKSHKKSEIDNQSIVLDEFLGQVLALHLTFLLLYKNYFENPFLVAIHLSFCLVFFRLFDITKPLFIGYADRKIKNGFGVMFDDFLAGIVTAAIGAGVILCCI